MRTRVTTRQIEELGRECGRDALAQTTTGHDGEIIVASEPQAGDWDALEDLLGMYGHEGHRQIFAGAYSEVTDAAGRYEVRVPTYPGHTREWTEDIGCGSDPTELRRETPEAAMEQAGILCDLWADPVTGDAPESIGVWDRREDRLVSTLADWEAS